MKIKGRDRSILADGSGDSSEMLKGVIDSIEDGAAIYDADDRLVQFNPPYLKYFELVKDIIKPGVSFRQIFEALAERGLYQGPQSGMADWVAGRVNLFESGAKKKEFQRANGQWTNIDYYKISGGGTFVVTSDITERKLMESSLRDAENEARELNRKLEQLVDERTAELQKNEALFRAVVNNSSNKIHIKDTEGRYTLINKMAEKLFGVTDDEGRGKTSFDLFPREIAEVFVTHDSAVIEIGESIEKEEEFVLEDGVHTFLTTKFPIYDHEAISGVGSIGTDITDRKLAEDALLLAKEEAEIANRAKSEFLATMSHELRTPLNAIIGFSEMLKSEIFGAHVDTRYLDYTTAINHSGSHLLEIINDILDISKIEAGEEKIEDAEVEVTKIVNSCIAMLKARAREANINMRASMPEHLPLLRADERHVKQIVINLLSNAVKFTPAGGQIVVSARLNEGSGIEILVEDTGIGILSEDIQKVLLPFGQVAESLNRGRGGTGLGLPICKSLIELHGGNLNVASKPGVGTTVTVQFPPERTVHS